MVPCFSHILFYDQSSGMDRQVIDSKRLANGWLALWVGIVAGNSYHQTRFCLNGVVWAKESDHIQDCIVWHFFWSIWSMVLHLCNILFAHLWIILGVVLHLVAEKSPGIFATGGS